MELVEQDRADTGQFRIAGDHALEHALGDDLDAGFRTDLRVKAHAVADGFADALAQQLRHAARGGAGGKAARFEDDDLPAGEPWRVEQRQRHQRRLAGAGRRDEDGVRPPGEGGAKTVENLGDRQVRHGRQRHRQTSADLDHVAAGRRRVGRVMGDEDDRQAGPFRALEDEAANLVAQLHVEFRERLVEEQEIRRGE